MNKSRSSQKVVSLSLMLLALALSFSGFSGVGLRVESIQRQPALANSAPIHVSPLDSGTFTLSGSPTELAFAAGNSGSSTVTVTSIGLTGTVMLTASVTSAVQNGPSPSMSPTSVHMTTNSNATSTLTVSTSSSTPAGHYDINVTAFKGAVVRTVFIDVAVTPLFFRISDTENFTKITVRTNGTLSLDSPSSSFTVSGSVTVVETSSIGVIWFSNTFPISRLPLSSPSAGGYIGRFVLNVRIAYLASEVSLTLSGPMSSAPGGPSATVQVSRNPDIDGNGTIDQADVNAVQAALGCSTGQLCYSPRLDLNADGTINNLDVNIVSTYLGSQNFLADFSMSASPTSITIPAGSSGASSLITINSIGGLTNPLTLSTVVSPSGLTASLTPTSVSLASGSGTSTLTVTRTGTTPNGTYIVSVRAKTQFLTRVISLNVNLFVGFNVTNTPDDSAVPAGSSSTFTITVTSINNFAGTVNLAATVSSSGPTTSLSPHTVTLTAGGSASSTLTVSTGSNVTHGLYGITVTGTIASEFHSTNFNVAVTPLSFTINDNENFTGVNTKTTASFSVDSPSSSLTFSGTATVVVTNATTGAALFSKTYAVTRYSFYYPYSGGYTGYFLLNVPVSPYRLSVDIGLTLASPTATAPGGPVVSYMTVSRNLDINGDGTVNQRDINIAIAAFDCSIGQSCYNPLADINAGGTIGIVDIGYLYLFTGATDFI